MHSARPPLSAVCAMLVVRFALATLIVLGFNLVGGVHRSCVSGQELSCQPSSAAQMRSTAVPKKSKVRNRGRRTTTVLERPAARSSAHRLVSVQDAASAKSVPQMVTATDSVDMDMPSDDSPMGPCDCGETGTCVPACCPPLTLANRLSVQADYLLWWSDGYEVPALVTTALPGTPVGTAGVLNEPNTRTLLGGGQLDSDAQSGGRIRLNYWFDTCRRLGVEATYLGVGKGSTTFHAASPETLILARPYYDTAAQAEAAMMVAHPNLLTGSIFAKSATEFQAVEVLFRRALMRRCGTAVDFVAGWRTAKLDESLMINHQSEWIATQGPIVPGTTKAVYDLFDTQNQFHGAELGILVQTCQGPWSLDLIGKLGLGNTRSEVFVDGRTTSVVPGAGSAIFAGGLLAQETNMGRYARNDFSVMPEVGVTLGYDITCRLRFKFGYRLLYWSEAARPGDQIDRRVSQLPPEAPSGQQRPEFRLLTSDYWIQGMNFGLEYCF